MLELVDVYEMDVKISSAENRSQIGEKRKGRRGAGLEIKGTN